MAKVDSLPAAEKAKVEQAAADKASLDVAISVEKRNIDKWTARMEHSKALLVAAKTRLRQLEKGDVAPPKYRKPRAKDHVAAPPVGKMRKTTV